MGVRGTRTPNLGQRPQTPGKARKKAGSPLRTVKGRVVFFCPTGKKISTPGPRGPPLTVLPWAALRLRRRTSPFQELARRLRQCTAQGRGSGLLSGGTTGADWPAPYGPPTRPAGPGGSPSLSPRHPLDQQGPLRRGRGPRFREWLQEAHKGPWEGLSCSWCQDTGQGSRMSREGPRGAQGGDSRLCREYYPALDILGRCCRLRARGRAQAAAWDRPLDYRRSWGDHRRQAVGAVRPPGPQGPGHIVRANSPDTFLHTIGTDHYQG